MTDEEYEDEEDDDEEELPVRRGYPRLNLSAGGLSFFTPRATRGRITTESNPHNVFRNALEECRAKALTPHSDAFKECMRNSITEQRQSRLEIEEKKAMGTEIVYDCQALYEYLNDYIEQFENLDNDLGHKLEWLGKSHLQKGPLTYIRADIAKHINMLKHFRKRVKLSCRRMQFD